MPVDLVARVWFLI